MLHARAEIESTRAKTLEDEMSASAARVGGLETDPWEANDSICDLEIQVKSHEEEVAKKDEYVTLLEDRYAETTTKSIQLEGQITILQVRLQSTEGRVVVEEKVMAIEVVAKAAKEEAARVVEQNKNFANFEDKVNEAIYDTYHKGFKECKRKVMQAFNLPDLKNIVIDEPEGAEKEGVANARGKVVKVSKGTGSKINIETS